MNLIRRLSKFFQEIKVELRKVHWPTRREFAVFFGVVLSTILVIGAFFWGLDYGLTLLLERFVVG